MIFKKILFILAGFVAVITFLSLVALVIIFVRPGLILTPANLEYALNKSNVFKSWSWSKATLSHQWIAWDERIFSGEFRDFCFEFENETTVARGCFEEISWQVNVSWSWGQGLKTLSNAPLVVRSSKLYYEALSPQSAEQKESTPPDIWSLWETLWSEAIPDLDVMLASLEIRPSPEASTQVLSLQVVKRAKQIEIDLNAFEIDFEIIANSQQINIIGPDRYPLKFDLNLERPLFLTSSEVTISMKESEVRASAKAELNELKLSFETMVELPLELTIDDPTFLKMLALNSRANIHMTSLQHTLKNEVGPPFDMLPAPLNVLDGTINLDIWAIDSAKESEVLVTANLNVDLEGKKQVLKLQVLPELALNLAQMTPGPLTLGLDLERVVLLLPRLSKTAPPPQFLPDSRIKVEGQSNNKKPPVAKKDPIDISFDLQATGKRALAIRTNLLDEPLRLNLDLAIEKGSVKKGVIEVLPLSTTIFKRSIYVKSAEITFNAPLEPTLKAHIEFRLPEYLVTLILEGPLSEPRPYFSSVPALPLDDIYAVLLFGRPMSDLGGDDRTAAQQTNRVLSQGILSLSVLYFFAGTPVESLGYDPATNELSAQIGLGSKNSLRVGSQDGSLGSVGIRRSLGKGWYLDTGVQKTSTTPTRSDSGQDYGVLLERVISY